MSTTSKRALVVVKRPKPVAAFLKFVAALIASLANPIFVNAAAVIAALTKAFTAADAAETASRTRAKGTVAARDVAVASLVSEIYAVKAFVQQTADADPENAAAIIAAAGFAVRKATTSHKPPFSVKQGETSGTVNLAAKAVGARASYDWEWSADGGKTWTQLPSTLQARTTMGGIVPGTNAQFRFRAVTLVGESDWSQPMALLVK